MDRINKNGHLVIGTFLLVKRALVRHQAEADLNDGFVRFGFNTHGHEQKFGWGNQGV